MNLVKKLIKADESQAKSVLVVGDCIRDVYIHGKIDVCQDGCQKFVESNRHLVPGGASNAAHSISNWHTEVIYFRGEIATSVKTRYLVDHKVIFRHDNEIGSSEALHKIREDSIHQLIYGLYGSKRPSAVLLSDYDKGTLTPEFIGDISQACKEYGIPCIADMKRSPEIYQGCILKGNSDYLRRYSTYMPAGYPLIITCGDENPVLFPEGVKYGSWGLGYNLPPVNCINHVGAGDCFAAHLALALAHGFPLKDAAAIAHSAGRVYVQFPHNRPPQPAEIVADMAGETLRIA